MNKIVLIVCLFIAHQLSAQDSHFSLSMGTAIPFGDLASSDEIFENGYASPGFQLSFEGNYIPTWYFGVGGSLNLSTLPTDADKMRADLKEKLSVIPPDQIPANATFDLAIGNWSYISILAGPTIAIPAGPIQVNGKAFIGTCIAFPPSNTFQASYNGNEFTSYNNPQTVALAYSLGADIIYNFSGTYSVLLGANYFSSYSNNTYTFDYINNSQNKVELPSVDSDIKLRTAEVYLGLAFLF